MTELNFNLNKFDSVIVLTEFGEVVVERTGRESYATFSENPEIYAAADTPEVAFEILGNKLRRKIGNIIIAEDYLC